MNFHMLAFPAAALAAFGAVALAGCASSKSFPVQIDAITKTKGESRDSYWIRVKGNEGDDSLRHQEAVNLVKTAFAGRGMYEAPDSARADVIIDLEYGVTAEPAVRTETTKVPVFARKGGTMRYEEIEVRDETGMITRRTVPVVEPPHAETVGYEERITSVPIFEKYIRISARENVPTSEGRSTAEIWSVNASIDTEGRDVRQYLPILASAAMDAIADDSGNMKTVNVKSNSGDVGFVKKGL